jgi:HIRAN domain
MSVLYLYLAWRQPEFRWWPIGRLEHQDDGLYVFRYTGGAEAAAEEAGFQPLLSFPDLHTTYVSRELFPLFRNRLMAEDRERFTDFANWLGLPGETDPMVLLGRSGGRRETDMFEVFSAPEPNTEGRYRMSFFVHGLSYRPDQAKALALELTPGEPLILEPDPGNPVHSRALRILARNGQHIGFAPRYLCDDLVTLQAAGEAVLQVQAVNSPPAPMQFRVLATVDAPWPDGFLPLAGPEFQPVASLGRNRNEARSQQPRQMGGQVS